jgi:hypothetical protein
MIATAERAAIAQLTVVVLTQQYPAPLAATPQLWNSPLVIRVNEMPPTTATGLERPVVVPSPSWPKKLLPQHHARASVATPQAWATPASSFVK